MKRRILRSAVLLTVSMVLSAGCARTPTAITAPPAAEDEPTSLQSTPAIPAGHAPDGTPIPGGKPTWLAGLHDPSTVDDSDPEAVMRAYVITAETWDTTVDRTSAYSTQRAAIYLTNAARQAAANYDPDMAKGQGQFLQAAQHNAYTTVVIRTIVKEGLDPDQGGDVHRIVHYLVRTTPRDGSSAPAEVARDAWVTAQQEDGQWHISNVRTQTS